MTVVARRNRDVREAQLSDAQLSGYATAMNQLRERPDAYPGVSAHLPEQGRPAGDTRKRGS